MDDEEIRDLVKSIILNFNEKKGSALGIKSQVYIINKLAKEDRYRSINETVLTPLWQSISDTYS